MNDYLDITASELLKELHNFFLINTYNGAENGFWVNEKALIDNLQHFILELGKGYSFVARQKHIRTETADFYIDLVFYN